MEESRMITRENIREVYEAIRGDKEIGYWQDELKNIMERTIMPIIQFRTEKEFQEYYGGDEAHIRVYKLQEKIRDRQIEIATSHGVSPRMLGFTT